MTQEEKELLLKDLCARIPYDTLVQLNPGAYGKPEKCLLCGVDGEEIYLNVDSDPFRINSIKPYLRPMSSMTEEEDKEWQIYKNNIAESCDERLEEKISELHDWFNSHHFDFHHLIEKGLALEAPYGMYKNE